jgi:hypothetical protein
MIPVFVSTSIGCGKYGWEIPRSGEKSISDTSGKVSNEKQSKKLCGLLICLVGSNRSSCPVLSEHGEWILQLMNDGARLVNATIKIWLIQSSENGLKDVSIKHNSEDEIDTLKNREKESKRSSKHSMN